MCSSGSLVQGAGARLGCPGCTGCLGAAHRRDDEVEVVEAGLPMMADPRGGWRLKMAGCWAAAPGEAAIVVGRSVGPGPGIRWRACVFALRRAVLAAAAARRRGRVAWRRLRGRAGGG